MDSLSQMKSSAILKESPITGVQLLSFDIAYEPISTSSNHRWPIGKQMESRLYAQLMADKSYEVLAHGLQVHVEGKTIGEFDYLLREKSTGQVIHLEQVHKYYIYDHAAGDTDQARWISPNYKDRLSFKLKKLQEHQFPLLYSTAAVPYLSDLGLQSTEIKQALCFTGECYLPEHRPVEDYSPLITVKSVQGRFMSMSQFAEENQGQSWLHHICIKQEWIARASGEEEWQGLEQTLEALKICKEDGRAIMIWTQKPDCIERCFILFRRSRA